MNPLKSSCKKKKTGFGNQEERSDLEAGPEYACLPLLFISRQTPSGSETRDSPTGGGGGTRNGEILTHGGYLLVVGNKVKEVLFDKKRRTYLGLTPGKQDFPLKLYYLQSSPCHILFSSQISDAITFRCAITGAISKR